MNIPETLFFYDWMHIDKGNVGVQFDSARISEEGRIYLKETTEAWGLEFDFSSHGFRRERMPYGIKLGVEKAKKSEVWMSVDRPWEEELNYLTVIKQGNKFRSWYSVRATKNDHKDFNSTLLCYAESDDGLNWIKPNLGIYDFNGSKDNNITAFIRNTTNVFYDAGAPESERYKCFNFDYRMGEADTKDWGMFGLVSPDGYHWTVLPDVLFRGVRDTQNIGYWDPESKKYLGFFREHCGGRAISRSETADFRNWPMPEILMWPGTEENPSDDYYTNCFCGYPDDPQLKLFFSTIFHRSTDILDVRLAVSREGKVFNWVTENPVIEIGRPGEPDSGGVYAGPNLVRFNDGRLALPYCAIDYTHNEAWYCMAYGDYRKHAGKYMWAFWEDGRLAGIEAENLGEFYTNSTIIQGNQIELNFRTHYTGSLELELQEKGKIIEGYSFDDCIPETGDHVWKSFRWKGKSDVSELKGRNIVMHFRLSKAKIFAARFV
ncbi:MAG: hypothetical protein FIA99_07705 [Ruminiclostridium sp.]|nr:hypothetical protein [Ruminiclostridium sp.]